MSLSKLGIVLVGLLMAPMAASHSYMEHGTVILPSGNAYELGVVGPAVSMLESIAPGVVPNGLVYYVVQDARGGDHFEVIPDDVVLDTPPDFDVAFSCGVFFANPGPEEGTSPCDGAIVYLFVGKVGEGFVWSED